MLNKNTWGVKSERPIRSNIANRHVQPKTLISAKAKKLLYQNYFQLLDWHTIVYSIFSQVRMIGFVMTTWPPFLYLNVIKVAKWQSQSYLWKYAINYCMSLKELKIVLVKQLLSLSWYQSFWLHMPVSNVASDWPWTFLHPRCFCLAYIHPQPGGPQVYKSGVP